MNKEIRKSKVEAAADYGKASSSSSSPSKLPNLAAPSHVSPAKGTYKSNYDIDTNFKAQITSLIRLTYCRVLNAGY